MIINKLQRSFNLPRSRGFSLLELMIGIVVVGILVSIAYPAYREQVNSARRADGKAALMTLANRMERYYSEQNTYANATVGTGNATTDIAASNLSPEGWYTLVIAAANANSYTLQAVPRNAQATADTRCQTLTLNNLGVKGVAAGPGGAPTATAAQCW